MRIQSRIRGRQRLAGVAVGLLFALVASHASAETIAITGGKVFPVSGPAIDSGTVVIVDGKITAVGGNVPIPAGARKIDAHGKWVTPGFIHSSTALGVVEVDAVTSSNDDSPKGAHGVAAGFRVWDALNPASELWAPARQGGVTAVVVAPSGDFVSGQAALVETMPGPVTGMCGRRRSPWSSISPTSNRPKRMLAAKCSFDCAICLTTRLRSERVRVRTSRTSCVSSRPGNRISLRCSPCWLALSRSSSTWNAQWTSKPSSPLRVSARYVSSCKAGRKRGRSPTTLLRRRCPY